MSIVTRVRGYSQKKKIGITAIFAVALIAVVGIFFLGGGETYTEVTAERRDMSTYYSFTGNIEANETQTVLAVGTNPVKKFYVEEGDFVQAGAFLVEFENEALQTNITQSQASLEIAEINYEKAMNTNKADTTMQVQNAFATAELNFKTAENNLNRIQQLYDNGASSMSELEDAQKSYHSALLSFNSAQKDVDQLDTILDQNIRTAAAQLNQSRASLANLERQLKDSQIYADISGTVSEIYVNAGEQIANGTQVMNLIDYMNLEVKIKIDEYGLTQIAKGKEVQVQVNAFNIAVKGTITKISESATVESGVSYFTATIALEPHESLRVGMSVEIKVLNQQADQVLTVPMAAIQSDSNHQAYVLVKDASGKPKNQQVALGINNGMLVEITEGLAEGDIVLMTGSGINMNLFNSPATGAGGGGAVRSGTGTVRIGPGGARL